MPYTEIHPIKSTLGKAIDYICNPEKTEMKDNIYTENCSILTADEKFKFTRNRLNSNHKILGYHIIQSFKYDEVDEQQALEIGIKTMKQFLGGQYEFIVAVHNDKNHIHNHVIINSVNMLTGKTFSTEHDRKYVPAWKQIRRISDEIAKEKGLSVIENPMNMGQSHYEWEQSNSGTSWKEKLKRIIDNTVINANSFDDFLENLKDENITIKYQDYKKKSGKCLGYKMEDQKYFVYTEKFGRYYSIESIKKHIERCIKRRNKSSFQKRFGRIMSDNGNLKKLYDLSSFDNIGGRLWAANENRKITMETLSEMKKMGFDYAEDFFDFYSELENKIHDLQNEANNVESSYADALKIKMHLDTCQNYKLNYDTYKNSFNPERYFRRHEKEILLFMQAQTELENTETSTMIRYNQILKN